MVKVVLAFLIVSLIVFGCIEGFRSMTKKERWSLTKSIGYSIIVATASVLLLSVFVILF